MATLDDKILGEKLQYYCSSSEDEDEGEEKPEEGDDDNRERDRCKNVKRPQFVPDAKVNEYEAYKGTSVNTGPKGVIRDWQRYKQLQNEQSVENNAELQALAKKLSLTCRSDLDEQKEKDKQKHEEDDLQLHLEEMEDEFLQQYRLKRMQEMMSVVTNLPKFGKLVELTSGQAFLAAIEKEVPQVNVIIHIYDDLTHACEAMNGCLQCLAVEYQTTKFCKIRAGCIGPLSKHFAKRGVPALLIYKAGMLIGNFVRLSDEFDKDFFAGDVEGYLVEHGMLPEKTLVPSIIRDAATRDEESDTDSDFGVD